MQRIEDRLWVWLLPERPLASAGREWVRHGGKWIVFDSRERIEALAEGLGPLIDSGEIESAKYWRGDPSAVNVYCLDRERERVLEILKNLKAGRSRVWEYDYAWDQNLRSPVRFLYSWCSKFGTILRSYGVRGTFRLMRDLFQPPDRSDE